VDAYEGAYHLRDLAVALAILGDADLALENLEMALSVPSTLTRADLLLDPIFRPLRDHPRFQELVATVQ
jgi:hypothetical protein